jgi:membrane-associated phospholipid phosphatase
MVVVSKLRPVDWGVLGYIAIATGVAVARMGRIPGVEWTLVANGFGTALVLLLARPGLGRLGRALREVYPLVLVILFYGALDILTGHGGIPTHESTVQRWEAAIFGGQVSHTWWQQHPSAFWSTFLHSVYASYYFVVGAGPIWFLARGDHRNLQRSVAAISLTYGLCFVIFLLYPVAGPNYEFPRPSPEFLDNPAAHLVYRLLQRGSSYGAAFPSSHVAAALTAALVAFRGSRTLGFILLVPAAILPVAVVYTQMHYAMDALAGVVMGAAVYAGVVLSEKGSARRGSPAPSSRTPSH